MLVYQCTRGSCEVVGTGIIGERIRAVPIERVETDVGRGFVVEAEE